MLRAADTLTCPVTLQRTAGDPHTHAHMAEQPISLDGADGVSPGAPNANAEGRDPVGEVVAIIGPRTTLASARDPETVLYRVKHEQRRSKPLRSNNPLWKVLGLAVVIDARVSRKVGRDVNKRITSRRDPRPFLLGIIFAPLSW